MAMSGNRSRIIKLYCPSLSKLVDFIAWDEQRLDLGSIARTFGLDPSTLKLNGHFISRGVDLIASSVTWNSLLSFFSSKGLSTGKDDNDALLVDGKLCKVGCKRAHDPQDISCAAEHGDKGSDKRAGNEDMNLLNPKKLKESNSGREYGTPWLSKSKLPSLKRKQSLEEISLLKKLKINDANSDVGGRGNGSSSSILCRKFSCSYLSKNLKRTREDEAIIAAPFKKIR